MFIDQNSGSSIHMAASRALRMVCQRSFYRFVKEFWDVIIPKTMVDNWHIKYICDAAQEVVESMLRSDPATKNLVINVPPTTSKSTIISQMLTPWMWSKNPNIRHISSSHTDDLVTRDVMMTRDIVISSKYRDLFPEVVLRSDAQGKSYLRTTSGGTRYSTSTNATPTGEHADIKTIDDPLGKSQAVSVAQRQQAIRHIEALATRNTDPSRITPTIMAMQRLHPEDPTAYYLGLSLPVRHICLPAEIHEGATVIPIEAKQYYVDGLLDPIRLPRETLDMRRRELGDAGYYGEFLQNPQIAAQLLLPLSDVRQYNATEYNGGAEVFTMIGVDPANKGDNYCACVADFNNYNTYVRDFLCNNRGVEYNIPATIALCRAYRPNVLWIEGIGGWIQTALDLRTAIEREMPDIKVIISTKPQGNKEAKIMSQSYFIKETWYRSDYKEDEDYRRAMEIITGYSIAGGNKKDDSIDILSEMIIFARDNKLL